MVVLKLQVFIYGTGVHTCSIVRMSMRHLPNDESLSVANVTNKLDSLELINV